MFTIKFFVIIVSNNPSNKSMWGGEGKECCFNSKISKNIYR